MDKKLLKFFKIVDLNEVDIESTSFESDQQDERKIKHFDYVQIDNKIISVCSIETKNRDSKFSRTSSDSSGTSNGCTKSQEDEEQLLSIQQDCLNVSVFDMNSRSSSSKECSSKESSLDQIDTKERGASKIRSINLPWYGSSMFRHEIVDVKIKDYWLYIFTK